MPQQQNINAEWLISPLPVEEFFLSYWEKKPAIVQGRNEEYFNNILTLSQVDALISSAAIAENSIKIVKRLKHLEHVEKSEFISNDGLIDPVEVCKLYNRGYTVILDKVHRIHPGLKALCVSLADDLGLTFHTNLYLTPPDSQGFLAHYDTHDVFILQISGEKAWKIFDSPYPLRLKGQNHYESCVETGQIQSEIELRPGDLIYLPRGCIHSAECRGRASLHVTLGVHSRTWAEFIIEAMSVACTKDQRLREGLPVKLLRDLDSDVVEKAKDQFRKRIQIAIDAIDFDHLVKHYFTEVNSRVRPEFRKILENAMNVNNIDMDTTVICPTKLARVRIDSGIVEVIGFEKSVTAPLYCEKEAKILLSGSPVKLSTLRGSLDDGSIISLVKRLAGEGMLAVLPGSM